MKTAMRRIGLVMLAAFALLGGVAAAQRVGAFSESRRNSSGLMRSG